MGYFPPKCTCNGNQIHSSKTCKSLLKCLHDMDENVTHPVTPINLYRYKLGKIIMIRICIGISYGK